MPARKVYPYEYEEAEEPTPSIEMPKEPLIRREVNTNLRNCLRAIFCLIALGAMVVTLLGGISANNGYTLLETQQNADQLEQENERLKIEIAQLKSPARIEAIAVEQLHMQVPQNMYFSHEGE